MPQDKACIDQGNIQQSLACLPVFLAGCQTLLVVAGPTYCARLWCVMELFTFARSERHPCYTRTRCTAHPRGIRMLSRASQSFVRVSVGGDQERVEIYLIAHPDDDQTESRILLSEQFETFDAGKARCFLASDREHLLAVIEAGFGDFCDFNRVARNLLASRLHDTLRQKRRSVSEARRIRSQSNNTRPMTRDSTQLTHTTEDI